MCIPVYSATGEPVIMKLKFLLVLLYLSSCNQEQRKKITEDSLIFHFEKNKKEFNYQPGRFPFPEESYLYFTNPCPLYYGYELPAGTNTPDSLQKENRD